MQGAEQGGQRGSHAFHDSHVTQVCAVSSSETQEPQLASAELSSKKSLLIYKYNLPFHFHWRISNSFQGKED